MLANGICHAVASVRLAIPRPDTTTSSASAHLIWHGNGLRRNKRYAQDYATPLQGRPGRCCPEDSSPRQMGVTISRPIPSFRRQKPSRSGIPGSIRRYGFAEFPGGPGDAALPTILPTGTTRRAQDGLHHLHDGGGDRRLFRFCSWIPRATALVAIPLPARSRRVTPASMPFYRLLCHDPWTGCSCRTSA